MLLYSSNLIFFLTTDNYPQVITEEPFLTVFPQTRNSTIQGTMVALLEVGALIGSLMYLGVGDRFGRRDTVFVEMGFTVVGGALQASAWSLGQMMADRVLSGIGLGLQVATVPL